MSIEEILLVSSMERLDSETRRKRRKLSFIVIHLALVSFYTLSAIIFATHTIEKSQNKAISSLNVVYQTEARNLYESSEFVGIPSPIVDAKWEELLGQKNMRVSRKELENVDRDSIPLPESGYLGWLGIFHEIHCLNMLRKWKYKDYYYPQMDQKERLSMEGHTDHCLDRIRATLMCHPDFSSLTTFFWDIEDRPKVNATKTLHSCINWETMMKSLEERHVPLEEMAAIKRPENS